MSGNPWDRVFGFSYRGVSYNKEAQDHADRMAELSCLNAEREWLEKRKMIVEHRIREIERTPHDR